MVKLYDTSACFYDTCVGLNLSLKAFISEEAGSVACARV